jgi:hypothetical protein
MGEMSVTDEKRYFMNMPRKVVSTLAEIAERKSQTRPHPGVMSLSPILQWCGGQSLLWQVLGLLLVWIALVVLHWQNDGLWPQGDAARHAANGLFWRDFLAALPVPPVPFALSY